MRSIRIRGAREHNLKDVSLDLPRDRLTVLTGVSGSGKSSLAFDTIYREGRRRFLESLPAYARRFLGGYEKPDVESIEGLSPAVSIEQKTVGRSPRSTVGTITEIYDHLRLLYARVGLPHCPGCGRPVRSQSPEQVVEGIFHRLADRRILVCAPLIIDRRGEHRRELERLRHQGFTRLRVDGQLMRTDDLPERLDRGQRHTVEVVWDRQVVRPASRARIVEAVEKCFALADRVVRIVAVDTDEAGEAEGRAPAEHLYSGRFACPDCEVDLPALEPRLFSFNSPEGACPRCEGRGQVEGLDEHLLVEDAGLPMTRGGLAVTDSRRRWLLPGLSRRRFQEAGERLGWGAHTSWADLDDATRRALLRGDDRFPGLVPAIEAARNEDPGLLAHCARDLPCPECGGSRLSPVARAVTVHDATLPELCATPVAALRDRLGSFELEGAARVVGQPILVEVLARLRFLDEVGLPYLTLDRRAATLSGGEAQRIRLASSVGAELQGMVFVLDEPSIGLHARDQARLLSALDRLRDQGNTVIVVEHDRDTILHADHVVDLGPGAGREGGELIAEGSVGSIGAEARSVTGSYLTGRSVVRERTRPRPTDGARIELLGVRHHNLRDVDAEFPLGCFVAVTGVSGSGKSSLVNHVLRPALRRRLGSRSEVPGSFRALRGANLVDKVVVIDQSPIGRSPRSNPATYTKVFGPIRELFARVPEARARGYGPGRFSFNVAGGRCLECGGAGVLTVDMQFLAPVEIVCDACAGRRYHRETLEIRYRGKTISEVLDLTVDEALSLFRAHPKIARTLELLSRIGLGYITLGQPSTTLSGGEAQRLKLATELGRKASARTIYILDEPTTGLHFDDVRVLLEALHALVDRGSTVVVIEHHLDVIRSADWIIDLGPEGGDAGGQIVATGPLPAILAATESHTGRALREESAPPSANDAPRSEGPPAPPLATASAPPPPVVVEGASIHNLRSVDVEIPRESLTVVTGVSGSGKTSLAFDTLFAEGQRRYLESLSTYARQFLGRLGRPPATRILALAPAIAIDQRSVLTGARSTVGTATEIHDHLRLLFARVGQPHCPDCGMELDQTTPSRLAEQLTRDARGERLHVMVPLEVSSPDGAALRSVLAPLLPAGFTRVRVGDMGLRLDEIEVEELVRRILPALRSLPGGGAGPRGGLFLVIDRLVLSPSVQTRLASSLDRAFEHGGGVSATEVEGHPPRYHTLVPSCPRGHFSFDGQLSPRMFSFNSAEGACERCSGLGTEKKVDATRLFPLPDRPVTAALDPGLERFLDRYRTSSLLLLRALLRQLGVDGGRTWSDLDEATREIVLHGGTEPVRVDLPGGSFETAWAGLCTLLEQWSRESPDLLDRQSLERLFVRTTCSRCRGDRLRREILGVRVGDRNLPELERGTVREVREFLGRLTLSPLAGEISRELRRELDSRLLFLERVGLEYLTLDRPSSTLSGGEAQRIRLASQLGSRLAGVLYVLDEPTVGLHPRDTRSLLASLEELRDLGNTVVVVEHDRDVIEAADHVIELGPGAGRLGGEVIATGTPQEIAAAPDSPTGEMLRLGPGAHVPPRRRPPGEEAIRLLGARCHNLVGVDAEIPLGLLTVVTGVSGSGKSTLVLDVLARVLESRRKDLDMEDCPVQRAEGVEAVRRHVVVDQRPIGRTPKSTPATYAGLWTPIRELFARLPLSRVRGYGPERFSFNSPGGRCEQCDGQGRRVVDMQFLSDVWVECEACRGRRFDDATREVLFHGLDISDVLQLEVDRAAGVFANVPRVAARLAALQDVGLGYVQLGQSASTLSGGEAQRVKLAAELIESPEGGTLYILDEPTTGLHQRDVLRLLEIFRRLVDGGNTLVVIEHQSDVIANADWVIELGPGAGEEGGRIVAAGTPEDVAGVDGSPTGDVLLRVLGSGVRGPGSG